MTDLRLTVRQKFHYCCGYCGVSEVDVGSELEIDHFQPRSRDGSDLVDNLVYSCSACNRNKASYWPRTDTPQHRHLLHPQKDDFSHHIRALDTGYLDGLTRRGEFHIEWLHLNRPQLVLHRRQHLLRSQIDDAINQLSTSNQQLKQQLAQQRNELNELNKRIRQLQGRSS